MSNTLPNQAPQESFPVDPTTSEAMASPEALGERTDLLATLIERKFDKHPEAIQVQTYFDWRRKSDVTLHRLYLGREGSNLNIELRREVLDDGIFGRPVITFGTPLSVDEKRASYEFDDASGRWLNSEAEEFNEDCDEKGNMTSETLESPVPTLDNEWPNQPYREAGRDFSPYHKELPPLRRGILAARVLGGTTCTR